MLGLPQLNLGCFLGLICLFDDLVSFEHLRDIFEH